MIKWDVSGHRGQTDDEDLARALQESLNVPPYRPYAPVQYLPRGYRFISSTLIFVISFHCSDTRCQHFKSCRICGGCKHEIGYGHYLSCMGTFWHPQCFRCYACRQPICETEVTYFCTPNVSFCFCFLESILRKIWKACHSQFSLSGSNPYHKICYKELHHPKCDVCHQFVRTFYASLLR